uniref:Phospholipid-transporting ATPase VD n=1 Tax=Macrostomum lignano TaxID=282301 RepID=A0A1I8JNB1_9PLAT
HLRRLVFPSLLFNSVLFTSQLISSCVLTLGHRFWCSSIINDLEDSEHVKELMRRSHLTACAAPQPQVRLTCPLIQSFPWRSTHPDFAYFRSSKFFGLITIAQISSWMVSLTLLILSIICGERFFKAVWFGEFEGSQDSLQPQPQPQQRRSKFAPKATEAAAAAPGSSAASTGQLRNGMVREKPERGPRPQLLRLPRCRRGTARRWRWSAAPGTAAAAVAMAEQQQQQQPDCLPGDTLMANRSALAGYERSLAARQRSAGGQSGRSLGGASGGLSSSLASSATPLLALETPQSPHRSKETQLWEPRVQQHHHLRQQSHPPNNSLTMRQHGGGRSRDCNLYSAYRVFGCQSRSAGRLRQEARMAGQGAPRTSPGIFQLKRKSSDFIIIGVKTFPPLLPRPPSSINRCGAPERCLRDLGGHGFAWISAQRPDTPQHVQRLLSGGTPWRARFRTFGARLHLEAILNT